MASVDERNLGAIRPTLFLGLGGTGKEVLLRLRRKFYERLGVKGLPCTAYLWMDTDTKDHMAFGEKMDEIFQSVAFEPGERLALLEGNVRGHMSHVLDNSQIFPHVHRWLYPEVARYGAEISDGAGGVRAVGRLTFFHHYANAIEPRISEILSHGVAAQEKINDTKKFFQERGKTADTEVQVDVLEVPQVVIVSSLAGGTGCGTILDAAFLLRYLDQKCGIPIERTIGILFMPNIFYASSAGEMAQRSYGNAYAALKELEFYTLRIASIKDQDLSVNYQVEWERDQTRTIKGPPFSVAYIEEMKNEAGIALDPRNRAEVFNMVAESLFLDFMPGEFSAAKRSHYSNVTQFLSSSSGVNASFMNVSLPQTFARRYASFGMSKIEIPMDALKGACAALLACEILQYINRESRDPNIKQNVLADVANRRLDAESIMDRFGPDWRQSIRDKISGVFRAGVQTLRDIHALEEQITAAERSLVYSEGTDPTEWGTAVSLIRAKTDAVSRETNEALLAWLRECLENDARGLRALLAPDDGYLRFMSKFTSDLYSGEGGGALGKRLTEARHDADAYRKQKETALRELRLAVASRGLTLLGRKTWALESLRERVSTCTVQHCLARATVSLIERAVDVARRSVEFLSKTTGPLLSFSEAVARMSQSFRNRHGEYLNFSDQVLFIRLFDREHDWGPFYALEVDDQGHSLPVSPKAEYRRFLAQSGAKATLWDLIEAFETDESEFRGRLDIYSEKRFFADFEAYPREIEVLNHPKMRETWKGNIERLVRSAMPMARCDKSIGAQNVSVQKLAYLGICPSAGDRYKGFVDSVRQLVTEKLGANTKLSLLQTDKKWEIYLYTVSYAFPLPALPVVAKDAHKAYGDFYRALVEKRITDTKQSIPLHLANGWEGKFEDLVVYTDESAKQVAESREVLLFGGLVRVVRMRAVNHRLEFSYNSGAPHHNQVAMGARRDAIDRLSGNIDLRQSLLLAVRDREQGLSKDALEAYYWVLTYLYRFGDDAEGTAENTLVHERMERVYARLVSLGVPADSLDHRRFARVPQDTLRAGSFDSGTSPSDPTDDAVNEVMRAEIKKQIGSRVEWVGNTPVLSGLTEYALSKSAGS